VEESPGADDNGSGVASVLAIAEILSQYEPLHTIKFVVYTGEEVGAYGSFNHARYSYEMNDKILAVLNLDMVGFANTKKGGDYVRFFETERGTWISDFCKNVSKKYANQIQLNIETVPNYPGSDHQAYIDYGYDAIFCAHYDGYPYGHSPNDSIDKINFSYHAKVTRLFIASLIDLANNPVETYIEITEPKEGYIYVLNRPIAPVKSDSWYLGLRGITVVVGRTDVIVETNGDIDKVIFSIDERMWNWDYEAPFMWKINAVLIGKHDIKVFAYGKTKAFDKMDIIGFIPYLP
jgi:Zn-dependent M28 family amino/carboxypeptidase